MGRSKFIIGGLLILAAVVYLIASSTQASAEYFMTVDEVSAQGQSVVGKSLRVSGAVVGDSIQYDPQSLTLTFDVAHVPGDNQEVEAQGGLAEVLHAAVSIPVGPACRSNTPTQAGLAENGAAIMTGRSVDGIFHADEPRSCLTKDEAVPVVTADASDRLEAARWSTSHTPCTTTGR
jgi:cytochrome c-type biogenesis protein CcmE